MCSAGLVFLYFWGDAAHAKHTTRNRKTKQSHPTGNEQDLTTTLLEQIINITMAMDAKSHQIGAPLFRYCIGHNLHDNELKNSTQLQIVQQFITNLSYLGDRIFWDLHMASGDPDSVGGWETMVEDFQSIVDAENSQMRFVVLEENGDDHGLLRGWFLFLICLLSWCRQNIVSLLINL